ncbi:uncharacterized protein LOC136081097 [Hydra vulgaris]|uniref:Uncharacterized protein LOC136081097 n=1 Tax=Hydra vulgaris TaxID=6087 RepID=A0ABM4BYZ7_HYDVU
MEIKLKFDEAMEPFHFLANLTDIKYQGKSLSIEQEAAAEVWLSDRHNEYVAGYYDFRLKVTTTFPPHMFNDNFISTISSERWWGIIDLKQRLHQKSLPLPEGFAKFFQSLHSCPASTGSIERVFSTFGIVWSKLRNWLGSDRAEKLVRIYRHLRGEEFDW